MASNVLAVQDTVEDRGGYYLLHRAGDDWLLYMRTTGRGDNVERVTADLFAKQPGVARAASIDFDKLPTVVLRKWPSAQVCVVHTRRCDDRRWSFPLRISSRLNIAVLSLTGTRFALGARSADHFQWLCRPNQTIGDVSLHFPALPQVQDLYDSPGARAESERLLKGYLEFLQSATGVGTPSKRSVVITVDKAYHVEFRSDTPDRVYFPTLPPVQTGCTPWIPLSALKVEVVDSYSLRCSKASHMMSGWFWCDHTAMAPQALVELHKMAASRTNGAKA